MSEMDLILQKKLNNELISEGLEIVDLIAMPKNQDRMLRFRTLQEVLNDFDSHPEDQSAQSFIVHVRKKGQKHQAESEDSPIDEIYLPNGRLNVPCLMDNAKLLMSAGEHASAQHIYQTLIHAGENTAQAHLELGKCNELQGNTDSALKNYEESILYYPTLESYHRFASLLMKLKRDQQASEVLERAIQLSGLSTKTQFDLNQAIGNCAMRAGLHHKAERAFNRAWEIEPTSDQVALNLGILYLQQGKVQNASQFFHDAMRLNPKNDRALSGLATCELSLGKIQSAHDYWVRSLQLKVNNPKAIFHLVKCAYTLKNYRAACDLLNEYIQVAPFNADLLYSLAGLHYHLGEREDTHRVLNQIISIQPEHAGAKKLGGMIGVSL
jgi:tetratricopeptide (TPR) repeat protein